MAKTNIPLRVGARVTHVTNERCIVGVIVNENESHPERPYDVHWQTPPWVSDRGTRGSYTSEEIKRTYIREKEVKKLMQEIYGWDMISAFE